MLHAPSSHFHNCLMAVRHECLYFCTNPNIKLLLYIYIYTYMYISYSHIFPSYPYYPFLCDLWPFRAIPDLVYFLRCQSSESISARFPDPKDTLEALKMLDEAQDVLLCESSQLFCKEKNSPVFFWIILP